MSRFAALLVVSVTLALTVFFSVTHPGSNEASLLIGALIASFSVAVRTLFGKEL